VQTTDGHHIRNIPCLGVFFSQAGAVHHDSEYKDDMRQRSNHRTVLTTSIRLARLKRTV